MFPRSSLLVLGLLAAGCGSAPPAVANIPAPTTLTNVIRIPAAKNLAIGTLTFSATYTDSSATLTASAPTVNLGAGAILKVSTCVMTHTVGALPSTTCSDATYDTRTATAMLPYAVPKTTRTLARPKAGGRAFAAAQVLVYIKQADGTWGTAAATSWPLTGLAGAGIAIPAVGASTATLPGAQGVPFAGGSGGVDTGYPDSMCVQDVVPAIAPAPGGVSTTALGTLAAAYEVGQPTNGAPAKGVMILLHGGGWMKMGPGGIEDERPNADRWRSRGWRTVNSTYRGCGYSIVDALALYDRVRTTYGSSIPVCLSGSSAGANLALLVAAQRPGVYCVIGRGAPTDLAALGQETAYPDTKVSPAWVENLAVAAFGMENLPLGSPDYLGVRSRVLLATAAHDPLIPQAQATLLRNRMLADDPAAYVDVDVLDAGTVPWVHAKVSQAAEDDYEAREQALVAPLG